MSARIVVDDEGQITLHVEVRVDEAEIEATNGIFAVTLKGALLELELDGLSVIPASKFGELAANPQTFQITEEDHDGKAATVGQSHKLSGSMGVGVTGLKMDGTAAKEAQNQITNTEGKKTTKTYQTEHLPVRAINGNRWHISEADSGPLRRKYLNDDALCRLTAKGGANNIEVRLRLVARQHDLAETFHPNGRLDAAKQKLGLNKDKLLSVLIAKGMHVQAGRSAYSGTIELASIGLIDDRQNG